MSGSISAANIFKTLLKYEIKSGTFVLILKFYGWITMGQQHTMSRYLLVNEMLRSIDLSQRQLVVIAVIQYIN